MTEQELAVGDLHHAEAEELASRRGWLHSHTEEQLDERWPGAPFGAGSMAKIHNVVRGEVDGVPITAFDYRFFLHDLGTDQFERHALRHYLVLVVDLGVDLPPICAVESEWQNWQPQGPRVEIDHERFGQHYNVHAEEPELAERILYRELMDGILHRMRATEWRIEDGVLVVWGSDQHVHRDLEGLLEAVLPLAERARQAAATLN